MKRRTLLGIFILCCFHHTTVASQEPAIKHAVGSPRLGNAVGKFILSLVLGAVTGLICALVFALLIRSFVRYMNSTPILKGPVVFSPKIAPLTLQLALSNENQLLGSSPNGTYYKTILDNGLAIAVKRLEPFDSGSPEAAHRKSIKRRRQRELEMLAGLRHRNLMSLRAFVRESDRFSLVYDFMVNGSLEDVMNRAKEKKMQLGWELRLRIAVGIVKGLEYLHFSCIPQILHYNLKPTNVMLDAQFEPRLGDCGLAKLMPNFDRATSAYTAPECLHSCSRYGDKSDVFSFGVILGMLLSGRDPMDPFFREVANGGSLGRWLRHLQQAGEAREALDKSIIGEEEGGEEEMVTAVKIAVVCQSDSPLDRPSSDELVSMLTQLHSF